jgi:hypothetical protein
MMMNLREISAGERNFDSTYFESNGIQFRDPESTTAGDVDLH